MFINSVHCITDFDLMALKSGSNCETRHTIVQLYPLLLMDQNVTGARIASNWETSIVHMSLRGAICGGVDCRKNCRAIGPIGSIDPSQKVVSISTKHQQIVVAMARNVHNDDRER